MTAETGDVAKTLGQLDRAAKFFVRKHQTKISALAEKMLECKILTEVGSLLHSGGSMHGVEFVDENAGGAGAAAEGAREVRA